MKERNYALPVFLLLLIAAAIYLAVRFYPVWKAAEYVRENMDLTHFSYEVEVELARERLSEGQEKLFAILAGLTGFEEADMDCLTLKGNVWEDRIHVMIYPKGAVSPLVELYLSDDMSVINETMIYNAIRNHLAEKLGVLSFIMPEQKETLYITLEQVEQIFGIDLQELRNFSLVTEKDSPATLQYFLMMAAMSREKTDGGNDFQLETEQLTLRFEVPKQKAAASLRCRLEIQEPAELMEKEGELLRKLDIPADGEQLALVKRFSVTVMPGGEEISMPANFVNQTVVDLISGIREWIMKLGGGNGAEPGAL